ncbi:MAG: DNA polymerase IV [Pseudomonadales bacterium]
MSDSIMPQNGPGPMPASSTMRKPESGPIPHSPEDWKTDDIAGAFQDETRSVIVASLTGFCERRKLPADSTRKIIHCDCDSFYASVEVRDDPGLRGLPVAIGGAPDKRGVVATCSYEARRYGIHSAMPMSQAVRLCPQLVIVRPRMAVYQEVSAAVHRIFRDFTSLVEPLSLDEAYLDVSAADACRGSATLMATEIRRRVREEIGITISAGIAPNKFLAKIASDWRKPDGQFTIPPAAVAGFVAELPVGKLFGVGSVTAQRMHDLGLKTCADLQRHDLAELTRWFGRFGATLHQLCRGIDERPVRTSRLRKSVSVERTYARDLPGLTECRAALDDLLLALDERLHRAGAAGRVTQSTIKVRFAGFETTTAARSAVALEADVYRQLLDTAWHRGRRPVRLLGIGVKLAHPAVERQLALFDSSSEN